MINAATAAIITSFENIGNRVIWIHIGDST